VSGGGVSGAVLKARGVSWHVGIGRGRLAGTWCQARGSGGCVGVRGAGIRRKVSEAGVGVRRASWGVAEDR
jgi:hypothetical protein